MHSLVDVLLATHNGERFLSEQIESILAQSYKDWTLLIHDDGSTDRTMDVARDFANRYPDKIKLIEDEILCGSARGNFSHLLSLSRSEYCMFCDQDDVWNPDKISLTMHVMQDTERLHPGASVLVHTDLTIVDGNLKEVSWSMKEFQSLQRAGEIGNDIFLENHLTGCTMMLNRALANCHSKEILENAIIHDWWIAMTAYCLGVISYIDVPTMRYRQHGNNDTGAKSYTALDVTKMLLNNPREKIHHILTKRSQILLQMKRFYYHVRNNPLARQDIIHALGEVVHETNFFRRKIKIIKYHFLSGTFLKKIAKAVIY